MFLFIALLFSIILLSACSGSTDEVVQEQKSRVTVDFSTFQVEVEDMGGGSRTTPALSDVASRLSFAVFNSKGALVENAIHQVSGDDDFGSVQMELYPGTYQMVAVAHNGDDDASISSVTSAVLPGTTITDTFTKVQSLTVESNQDCSLDMTLNRITSAFILKLNDTALPANLKDIKVVVNANLTNNPSSLVINPSTGFALANWKQTCVIPKANLSNDNPVYFIGIIKDTKVTITATAYDTSDNIIISHTLNSVPLTPNKKTVASGTFFQSSASGTFTVNSEWLDDNNIEY